MAGGEVKTDRALYVLVALVLVAWFWAVVIRGVN